MHRDRLLSLANRGPESQVGSQVRSQPTGLVAIMYATRNASHHEIEEEEPEKQKPDNALDARTYSRCAYT